MTRATPSAALLLLAAVLPACGEAVAVQAAAAAAAPPDEVAARHAAEVAIDSVGRRKYKTEGCTAAGARVVADVGTSSPAPADGCSVLVARRPDGSFIVVVHSTAQLGNVSAWVTVSAGGEGVQHVEYKP